MSLIQKQTLSEEAPSLQGLFVSQCFQCNLTVKHQILATFVGFIFFIIQNGTLVVFFVGNFFQREEPPIKRIEKAALFRAPLF